MFETGKRNAKITEMWAFVCTDPADGCEAIPAVSVPDPRTGQPAAFPLVGADRARMMSMRQIALGIANKHGRPLRLVRFSKMETIEEIKPTVAEKNGIDMDQEADRA